MIYRMPRVRAAIALVTSLFLSSALAAPFPVQVGEARLLLDAPAGYADTTFTGSPRLQELAESLTAASNRILLFAISDGDLRRFTLGDPPEFRRYMLVATPRASERQQIDPATFQRIAEDGLRGLRPLPEGGDIAGHLESQPVGVPSTLAQLRRDPAVVSLLQGTRLEPTKVPRLFGSDERQNFMLSTSTLLLARGKVLNLSVFALYQSAEDAAWIRAVTAAWVEQMHRLNR
jgi:hypothetical protein